MTTLHQAAEAGSLDLIDALLEHGASIAAQDKVGFTPLHYAAKSNCIEAIQRLLLAGSTLLWKTRGGECEALHIRLGS
eukprot:649384-Pyramimonas_sp.AAC.3